jgi:uncharacterized membrane protein YdcZ (DUF606 family)
MINIFLLLLPLFVGLSVVTQGVLNQKANLYWDFATNLFVNALVFLVVSVALLFVAKVYPEWCPDYLKPRAFELDKFKWWFLIPGICGFFIVLGVPWSLETNGPSKTFIVLVVSQIILSLLLEKFVFAAPVSTLKLAGAIVAAVGASIVVMT